MKFPIKTAAALTLATMPGMAAAQTGQCLTSAEGQAVIGTLMPDLVTAMGKRCAAFDARGYLARNAPALSVKFQAHSRASWPAARTALERMGMGLPDNEAMVAVGRTVIATTIANEMKAPECDTVSRLTQQLEPLPPANFANVVALFVEAGARTQKNSQLKFCET